MKKTKILTLNLEDLPIGFTFAFSLHRHADNTLTRNHAVKINGKWFKRQSWKEVIDLATIDPQEASKNLEQLTTRLTNLESQLASAKTQLLEAAEIKNAVLEHVSVPPF